MLHHAPRALVISCLALALSAPAALAQRASIVYAGQGNATPAAAVTESAALTGGLAGGADNSYGYGQRRERRGAVIDLRRTSDGNADRVDFLPVQQVVQPAPQPVEREEQAQTEEGGRPGWLEQEEVGPPYQANGRWYVPTPEPGYEQTGTASWYGGDFHGRRTASGEVFDQDALTAAHPTLPIPSLVQVTNLANGREVIVRVNDRGPFVGNRLLDVSRAAAGALGFEREGHARVHVRYLGPAPRRVNADGTPAPASLPSPPPAQREAAEEGPASLLPPPARRDEDLAGAPFGAPTPVSYTPALAASGNYFVQVGAFSDLTNAHRVRDAVGAAGPVVVDVRQTANGELFRVRVGPWASREEADAARRTLSSMGYSEAVVAAR